MKYGVLGTGIVGQTIAAKLAELGHEVMVGTRDVAQTLQRDNPDAMGNPPFKVWHQQHSQVKLGTFAEAAAFGEILFSCLSGGGTLDALEMAGENNLNGKVLIDIGNPLDFSRGFPPSLSVCNTDSLGEQIQRAFPHAKVVKTLNTVTAYIMVNPGMVPGDSDIFVSGNETEAKATVTEILQKDFGWKSVIDLGDITTARGVEMMMIQWLNLMGKFKTPFFNIKIVRA
jgi:predicted dinucleotide-binding enzyme